MKQFVLKIRDFVGKLGLKISLRIMEDTERRKWRTYSDFQQTSMGDTLYRLSQNGIKPNYVIDIGANMGEWTLLLKSIFTESKVLMIEPQSKHKESLENICKINPDCFFSQSLLGATIQNAIDFYVADDGFGNAGSSVFPENSNVPVRAVQMPMTTLDSLILQFNIGSPDFIKLDVQGYELEVLRGAEKTMSNAAFVLLEVSTWPYNLGGPLMDEVIEWMSEKGFIVYDVCGIHRRNDGTLLQIDMLFIPKNSFILNETKTIYSRFSNEKM
jgi:FkbM family methyltransferase